MLHYLRGRLAAAIATKSKMGQRRKKWDRPTLDKKQARRIFSNDIRQIWKMGSVTSETGGMGAKPLR